MDAKRDSYRVAQVHLSDLVVADDSATPATGAPQDVPNPQPSVVPQHTQVPVIADIHTEEGDGGAVAAALGQGETPDSPLSSVREQQGAAATTPLTVSPQDLKEILDPLARGTLSIGLTPPGGQRQDAQQKEAPAAADTTDIQALLARMEEKQPEDSLIREAPPVPVPTKEPVQVIGADLPDMWEVSMSQQRVGGTGSVPVAPGTPEHLSSGEVDHTASSTPVHPFDLGASTGQVPDTVHARGIAETATTLGKLVEHTPQEPAPGALMAAQVHEAPASHLASIRTFRSDVEDTITHKRTSVVDMIAAEQKRIAASDDGVVMVGKNSSLSLAAMLLLGASIALIFAAGVIGVLFFMQTDNRSVVATPTYFVVEDGSSYVTNGRVRAEIMRDLAAARDAVDVRLGAMSEVRVTKLLPEPRDDTEVPVTSQEFFSLLALGAPDSLVRSLTPAFMLGVHEFAGEQPFLIFTTTYYQNAFRGMLAWEYRMQEDLHPLFMAEDLGTQVIDVPVASEPITATSTGTSTATTTGSTTPPTSAIEVRNEFRHAGAFEDVVTDNVPARVLRNKNGDVTLLWSIPDGTHIIITTNEHTLREVRKRLSEPGF